MSLLTNSSVLSSSINGVKLWLNRSSDLFKLCSQWHWLCSLVLICDSYLLMTLCIMYLVSKFRRISICSWCENQSDQRERLPASACEHRTHQQLLLHHSQPHNDGRCNGRRIRKATQHFCGYDFTWPEHGCVYQLHLWNRWERHTQPWALCIQFP